ncbi:serine/threonine-protein kinase [Micromonospora sagamiensis]|uniref:Serine/threonine protein kinase n=1 Tax=Micromonospora sagamiensis TaxID=47875 RepID=A0A562WNV7_9ACTN|nr:serine/threonine-protein kinase [Micromonospora sagamiensis]TWJ31074.1 serine/threonine protein kinase [Micromonospora sagamiensis]
MEPLKASDPLRIAGYDVLGRLGAGGMGQVFLAVSAATGPVALKTILPDLVGEDDFRMRFRREVAAARRVQGPYVAEVIDADVDGEPAWMATQYVPGPSLAQVVARIGGLPSATVRALAIGTAEALVSIGRAGLIHRDLKPANVLLGARGPRVIDFGIAKAAEASQLTRPGEIVGTAGYMAPEQIEGKPLSAAADVFSLGAVLTFALTGVGPYGQGSWSALMGRVLYHEPDLSRVPSEWVDIIRECLAKDPAARPTLTALRDRCAPPGQSIANLFEGDWLSAEATSFVEQQTRTAQRQQAAFQRGIAGVPQQLPPTVSESHSPGGHFHPGSRSSGPATGTAVREYRRRWWPVAAVLVVLAVVGISNLVVRALPHSGDAQPNERRPSGGTASLANPDGRTPEAAPPPDDALPARYADTWSGDVYQADIDRTYPVTVTLTKGRVGSVVGRVRYWTLQCAGELTLDEATDTAMKVTERITEGRSNCTSPVPLTLSLQSDGSMRYDGRGEKYPPGALTGKLVRSSPVLPAELVDTWRGTIHQYNTDESYEVVIVIKDREIGSEASVDYPSLRCSGTLTLQQVDDNTAWFTEKITRDERSPGCIDTGAVALGPAREGTSLFRYFDNPEDEVDKALAEGRLTRR